MLRGGPADPLIAGHRSGEGEMPERYWPEGGTEALAEQRTVSARVAAERGNLHSPENGLRSDGRPDDSSISNGTETLHDPRNQLVDYVFNKVIDRSRDGRNDISRRPGM
ncbi:hypothetical protein NDU88_000125 [Pleurodeles waltl]|uniref:Uncharacterized protein n=1 Tax=Pleurodeles waltl TaxID=8319 RepID=A0AAV7S983_PLEWA|nr:hypothetical protein NDU88_000125 [Pleurodeles waltl]